MKNFTPKFYNIRNKTFVEFIKPKLYADVNVDNPKSYSDVENFKLKFGYC
jgi:hypothetical protein